LGLLTLKFGEVPSEAQARLDTATEDKLDLWLQRLLSAQTLDAMFRNDG